MEKAIYKLIREFIQFPNSKICKHYVASCLLSSLEENGFQLDGELVKHVVDADDEKALRRMVELLLA